AAALRGRAGPPTARGRLPLTQRPVRFLPPSEARAGPAPPGRPACAPGCRRHHPLPEAAMRMVLLSLSLIGVAFLLNCVAQDFARLPSYEPPPPKEWTCTECPPDLVRTVIPEGAEPLEVAPLVVRGEGAELALTDRLGGTAYRKVYHFRGGRLFHTSDWGARPAGPPP